MEKEVIWTDHAKNDLRNIYEFNIGTKGEEKSFSLVERLITKTDMLYEPIVGGTRYISDLHPEIN